MVYNARYKMSVPFDQIYNFLSQYIDDDVLIYGFSPPGSKNIQSITRLTSKDRPDSHDTTWSEQLNLVNLLFHDQEPLHFDLYQNHSLNDLYLFLKSRKSGWFNDLKTYNILEKYLEKFSTYNLNLTKDFSIVDHWLLCHSEVNSVNLKKYQDIGAIGVYWLNHAMVAQDWYRYAKVDWKLQYDVNNHRFNKIFNIYNRAWTGTREYRLKFSEILLDRQLNLVSQIKFSPIDNGNHYLQYQFKNPKFQINTNLEILPLNQISSTASADYNADDYRLCAIDVVLETLFDDQRWHLTEKTFRPISCGKPFILVSTKGSLSYLRGYGFKTFGSIIDEGYDQIEDPMERLHAIIGLMEEITNMPDQEKKELFVELHQIAKHNQDLFWSEGFKQKIIQEFVDNYTSAYQKCQDSKQGKNYIEFRKFIYSISKDYRKLIIDDKEHRTKKELMNLLKTVRSTW